MSGYKSLFIITLGWVFFLGVGSVIGYLIGMSGPISGAWIGAGIGAGVSIGWLLEAAVKRKEK